MKIHGYLHTPPTKQKTPTWNAQKTCLCLAILVTSTWIHTFSILHAIFSPLDEKAPIYYLHTLPAGNPQTHTKLPHLYY